MRWDYVAIDGQGQEVRGDLEAADAVVGATQLRGRGLFPVDLAPATGPAAPAPGAAPPAGLRQLLPLRTADLVLFTTQLALMLRTGLTLIQALETLGRTAVHPSLRDAATRLATAVQAGEAFSTALERERLFPPIVAQLVRAAEATGELDRAFDRAAGYLERRAELRFQVVSSLTYPAIVVLVASGVFWFMATKVVPKFASFLAARHVPLPWTTSTLMKVSAFLTTYGPGVLIALAVLAAVPLVMRRTPGGRLILDRLLLRIPGLSAVLAAAGMTHLSLTLSLLLRSGLPLVQSLAVLATTLANESYARAVEQARERVLRGASLAESLEGPGVPPLTVQVIAVGERTGSLDAVLEELAAFYDVRLRRLLKTLASLVEPALLVVVGGMVGFVYISFFQALFQLAGR